MCSKSWSWTIFLENLGIVTYKGREVDCDAAEYYLSWKSLKNVLFHNMHIVWKLLKMSHLNIGTFHYFLVTLFDRKLQVFKNSPKWTIFLAFLIHFCPLKT